jgi:hypothetical protein
MTRLRTVPRQVQDVRHDAVVFHGMLSHAGHMGSLAGALAEFEHYRRIWRVGIRAPSFRFVPQVTAAEHAEWVWENRLRPALDKGELRAPLDLIGHSNGGYVALCLASALGGDIVRSVFTLGTPRGLPIDYALPDKARRRVFHLRGGRDLVPFGFKHDPGGGEWVITFPDEGHCSLHSAARTNGVARIMCFLAGGRARVTLGEDGKLHPWDYCRDEVDRAPHRRLGTMPELTVCDGTHDPWLERIETLAQVVQRGDSVLARLVTHFAFGARIEAQRAAVEEETSRMRAFGRVLAREVRELREENRLIARKLVEFDRRLAERTRAVKRALRLKLKEFENALDACAAIGTSERFGDPEMLAVNRLLDLAIVRHRELTASMRRESRALGAR